MKKTINININKFCDRHDLTSREYDILYSLVHDGGGNIGIALGIESNTVRAHFANIFRKTEISSKTEILRKIIFWK